MDALRTHLPQHWRTASPGKYGRRMMSRELVCATCSFLVAIAISAASGSEGSELTLDSSVNSGDGIVTAPFVLLARVDALVAGRDAARTDFYVGKDGSVQRSRYALSGSLQSLQVGTIAASLADLTATRACRAQSFPNKGAAADGVVLPSYFPEQLLIAHVLPGCEFRYWESEVVSLSDSEKTLDETVMRVFADASLRDARPGLYAIVIPVSKDAGAFHPDFDVAQAPRKGSGVLIELFARAGAMIRVSDTDGALPVAPDVQLERGRPLLVSRSGVVYMLASYWLPPNKAL